FHFSFVIDAAFQEQCVTRGPEENQWKMIYGKFSSYITTYASIYFSLLRMSSSTSANSYIPLRPTIQRAATRAPAANPSRDRAACVNVLWSPLESNPTRCVPGMLPARVDATGISLPSIA